MSRFHSAEPPFETERLILRELGRGDEAFILELLNEPAFIANIGDRGVRNIEDATRYITAGPVSSYERNRFGLYCVTSKASGDSLGICGLLKRDTLEHADLGFAFLERYRGAGYALEAASATVEQARTLGLPHVVAITISANEPSKRLLRKLGFSFEQVVTLGDDPTPLELFELEL